ncbi:MAG: hypothetical protein JWR19_441 [Pedosphaera sp.]|nr:hypothetical protein [Pedosphaera sp.]
MKHIFIILTLALVLPVPAFAQGIIEFNVNFGSNPPPHTPGVPDSGARLTDDIFYAAIYLDGTPPSFGSILERLGDGSFATVFQFTNLVFAGYPPPATGAAYDYEGSWQLTNPQIQNLLAGLWYAEITYTDTAYRGQITPAPEPSTLTLLLGGLIVLGCLYRHIEPPNQSAPANRRGRSLFHRSGFATQTLRSTVAVPAVAELGR